jgi:hypothetical protein
VATALLPHDFSGSFHVPPDESDGEFVGITLDEKGRARIWNIVLTETEFSFTKQYFDGKPHSFEIEYHFKRHSDGTWRGSFSVPEGDNQNTAHCVLQEVTRDFFTHPYAKMRNAIENAGKG